jgi:hypothetical protein
MMAISAVAARGQRSAEAACNMTSRERLSANYAPVLPRSRSCGGRHLGWCQCRDALLWSRIALNSEEARQVGHCREFARPKPTR